MKLKNPFSMLLTFLLLTLFAAAGHAGGLENAPSLRANTATATLRVHAGCSIRATFDSEDFAEAKVSVVNANGKVLVDQAIVLDPGANVLHLKVSDIPKGAYFVHVTSNSKTKVTTLVVK